MRVLESISVYEGLAQPMGVSEARQVLTHLIQRSKEDMVTLTRAISGLDAGLATAFAASGKETFRPGTPISSLPPALEAKGSGALRPSSGLDGIDEDLRLPAEPTLILHALPAPPSPLAGHFTVGPLRGRKP